MCGICGIYVIENDATIQRMLSVLRHGGPDDKGIYGDLGFRPGRYWRELYYV
jgi:asparagine synthetase B (glutamine-hydrolysing)